MLILLLIFPRLSFLVDFAFHRNEPSLAERMKGSFKRKVSRPIEYRIGNIISRWKCAKASHELKQIASRSGIEKHDAKMENGEEKMTAQS